MKKQIPTKNPTTSTFITHSGLALALVMTLAAWSPLHAESAAPASGSMMTTNTMAERHQAMQSRRETIMTEMMAQDTELNAQLAKLKSAPEEQKLDLLVAVVARMVEQRTAMHASMDKMMNQMTEDMPMEHGSMSSHSMMNGMGDKAADPAKGQN
ncbi:MAG: hypothetical protein ABI273_13995 [Lacunisphaera sp.]